MTVGGCFVGKLNFRIVYEAFLALTIPCLCSILATDLCESVNDLPKVVGFLQALWLLDSY